MDEKTGILLRKYAEEYETKDFLEGDPSWFMHQVEGAENRETMAFVAAALSYGSRKQFMPKIEGILDDARGDVYGWVRTGRFESYMPNDKSESFYRLYSYHTMNVFLRALQKMIVTYGSIGAYVRENSHDCLSAVETLCRWFTKEGGCQVIPKDTTSACKRLCMFLRWMVRSGSPVDLGLWAEFIDRRTLIIPMDTHVLQQAEKLGLISSRTTTMKSALKLSRKLAEIFPDDPIRGDFALFGYGVNHD